MIKRMSFEEMIESRGAARFRREAKSIDRMAEREDFASSQIGELVRDGRTVCYVWPTNGNYREGTWASLVAFLLRTNRA